MGETELRGNIIQGDGVYKSTDAGKTWTHVGLEKTLGDRRGSAFTRPIPTSSTSPRSAIPTAPNPERGVFRSKDGGKTWDEDAVPRRQDRRRRSRHGPEEPGGALRRRCGRCTAPRIRSRAAARAAASSRPPTAATLDRDHPQSRAAEAALGQGRRVGVAAPTATAFTRSSRPTDGGVFLSDDAGATWKLVNDDRRLRQRAFYYTRIYADPKAKDTVYVLNIGVYRSTDAGKTLRTHPRSARRQPRPVDRRRTIRKRMINANDGGANVSINGGETWTAQNYPDRAVLQRLHDQRTCRITCAARSRTTAPRACPSTGTAMLYEVGGGESGYIAPRSAAIADMFYAGSYGGLLTRINRRTGETPRDQRLARQPDGLLVRRHHRALPVDLPDRDRADRSRRRSTSPRSTCGSRPTRARAGQRISPDLTRHDPSTMGAVGRSDHAGSDRRRDLRHDLHARAVAGRRQRDLGRLGRRAGARHARRRQELDRTSRRKDLPRVRPHQPDRSVAARRGHGLPRRRTATSAATARPTSTRPRDYGKTWTKIVTGIGADDFARAIREDKKRRGCCSSAPRHGIYVSFDDGATWQSLQLDCRSRRCTGSRSRATTCVIGTHGRSFYSMDNIGVLRQIGRETTNQPVVLFQPVGRDPFDLARRGDRLLPASSPSRRSRSRSLDAARKDDRHLHRSAARITHGWTRGGAAARTGRGRGRSRCGTSAGGGQTGHEPLHLGHAVSRRPRFSGTDHVGRQHARAPGAARQVSGQADRRRRDQDPGLRDQAQRGHSRRDRCGSPRAVQAREGNQRQGDHRQRGRAAYPRI